MTAVALATAGTRTAMVQSASAGLATAVHTLGLRHENAVDIVIPQNTSFLCSLFLIMRHMEPYKLAQ